MGVVVGGESVQLRRLGHGFTFPSGPWQEVLRQDGVTAGPTSLEETLWLYQLGTGDTTLTQLANEVVTCQHEAQAQEEQDESRPASPAGLAQLSRMRLDAFREAGANRLISDVLAGVVPLAPTGERTKGQPINPREIHG